MKFNLKQLKEIVEKATKYTIFEDMENFIEGFEKELKEDNDSLESDCEIQRSEEELIKENESWGMQAVFDAGYCKGRYEKNREILGEDKE